MGQISGRKDKSIVPGKLVRDNAIVRVTILLLGALSISSLGTMWLVYEVRKEQQTISALLQAKHSTEIDSLIPMITELRWQLILAFVLLAVLIASATTLILILKEYFLSLRKVKILEQQAVDILESMEHGILTSNANGSVITTNKRAKQILELNADQPEHKLRDIDRLYSELDLAGLAGEVLKTRTPLPDRQFKLNRSGHQIFLSVDTHLLRGDEGQVLGTLQHLRDITQHKLMQERMIRMEGYMGLGPVAAGLHHEIKNPLSALSIHAKLLEEQLENCGHNDPQSLEHLDVLRTEIARIGNVLDSFKDYAKVEHLKRTQIDLLTLVSEMVRLMTPEARKKSIQLIIEYHPEGSPYGYADETRLRQVILNLILNGLQSMDHPGRIVLSINRSAGYIYISITDQGHGIPKSVADHIFDPYFTTKRDGVGMGLAVCRKIIRLHGGDLTFESRDKGTCFTISIPVNAMDAA